MIDAIVQAIHKKNNRNVIWLNLFHLINSTPITKQIIMLPIKLKILSALKINLLL